jgi:pimeloyl-ACP methyl ester carboxylesterase
MVISLFMFVVVVALLAVATLNGKARRRAWMQSDKTEIRFLPALDAEGNEIKSLGATVVITGAFNGPAHPERIAEALRQAADVYVLDYALLVFNPLEAVTTLYKALVKADDAKRNDPNDDAYQVIALIGASLGGLLSLLFVAHDRRTGGRFRNTLCVLGCDSPLLGEHLLTPGTDRPVPMGFARWLTGLRPGPAWNWVTSFVMPLVFGAIPLKEHSAGTDISQWERHMAFLKRTRLSLFLSQTGAIVNQGPLDHADFYGIPGGYLMCAKDDVIAAPAALAEWQRLFPDLGEDKEFVPGGHIQWVEHDIEWQEAITNMFIELVRRVIAKRNARPLGD